MDPMTDTLECFTTLAFLAGKFDGYDLGSIVMSQTYRNPALLAKMAVTLQTLSKGRFILRFADFPSTQVAETFAREVMPRFI